jgi:hypothetical protein
MLSFSEVDGVKATTRQKQVDKIKKPINTFFLEYLSFK